MKISEDVLLSQIKMEELRYAYNDGLNLHNHHIKDLEGMKKKSAMIVRIVDIP